MKRTLTITALVLIGLSTACTPAPESLAPCATEDSPGPCYWDSTEQGNGLGQSFTVDANQHVTLEGN